MEATPTTPDEIRALRKRLSLTQVELAARVGTAQAAVSRWERGRAKPSGPVRKLLSQLATSSPDEAA